MPQAVVTGAGRGIGRAIAHTLAREGFDLGLSARSTAELEQVASELRDLGRRAVVVAGDVTNATTSEALVSRTEAELGPIEVAVAGAGQALAAPFLKTSAEDFLRLFEVNTLGVMHLFQAAAKAMRASKKKGRLIAVGSTASVRGFRYTSAYAASKHALLGLVRSVALELAPHGIAVNAVCPGWVETEMFDATLANIAEKARIDRSEARKRIVDEIPMKEVLKPEEVAAMVGYLASSAAEKLTGQALVIDGGESLS